MNEEQSEPEGPAEDEIEELLAEARAGELADDEIGVWAMDSLQGQIDAALDPLGASLPLAARSVVERMAAEIYFRGRREGVARAGALLQRQLHERGIQADVVITPDGYGLLLQPRGH